MTESSYCAWILEGRIPEGAKKSLINLIRTVELCFNFLETRLIIHYCLLFT